MKSYWSVSITWSKDRFFCINKISFFIFWLWVGGQPFIVVSTSRTNCKYVSNRYLFVQWFALRLYCDRSKRATCSYKYVYINVCADWSELIFTSVFVVPLFLKCKPPYKTFVKSLGIAYTLRMGLERSMLHYPDPLLHSNFDVSQRVYAHTITHHPTFVEMSQIKPILSIVRVRAHPLF